MGNFELVIGNKAYSSWSLRAWLALKHANLSFRETRLAMDSPTFKSVAMQYSPTGKVPVLRDGDLTVWDSLSICEYLAEKIPAARFWPDAAATRATARSVSAEMHSGFLAIRKNMPFNCRATGRRVVMSSELEAEIVRVTALWRDCRDQYGKEGNWLFGRFSIADVMYIPVALRFATYSVELDRTGQAYVQAAQSHAAVREWVAAAEREAEVIETSEVGR